MSSCPLRFDVICDPTDHWTVWDHDIETPAYFGGEILHGLSEGRAQQLAMILNEIYSNLPEEGNHAHLARAFHHGLC